MNIAIFLPFDSSNMTGGYSFHTHQYVPGWEGVTPKAEPAPAILGWPSTGDFEFAEKAHSMQHFLGFEGNFTWYGSEDGARIRSDFASSEWDKTECEKYLPSRGQ
jgi:hypothetical protein